MSGSLKTDSRGISKVTIRRLPVVAPPAPPSGGRIQTPAGELAQLVSSESFRHLAYLELKPDGSVRGNHYHNKKREHCYIIGGKVEAVFVNIATGEREVHILTAGDLLVTPVRHAHAFKALEYTQLIEFAPEAFDVTDIIKYPVV